MFSMPRGRWGSVSACMPTSFRSPAALNSPPRSAPPLPIIWSTPAPRGFGHSRAAGVQPVLLPGSVYALGSRRYPDARAMIDAGLAVVLATDFNPGSSPTPSLPIVLSLASTQMKMTPAEAVTAATVNAAASLGMAGEIGSLAAGRWADIAVYDTRDYREIAYYYGAPLVWRVYAAGVRVCG